MSDPQPEKKKSCAKKSEETQVRSCGIECTLVGVDAGNVRLEPVDQVRVGVAVASVPNVTFRIGYLSYLILADSLFRRSR